MSTSRQSTGRPKCTQESVLILGAGCFGLATALQLASAGYSVTVLERGDDVPSQFSAAYDMNKVIRAEYIDPLYRDLTLKAIEKWQTEPLYKPHFHQTGFLNVTSKAATKETKAVVDNYLSSIRNHPAFANQVSPINGSEDVKSLVPAFKGPVAGWTGYYNELAGYGHSANALRAVYKECLRVGVQFYLGENEGKVESLLYASSYKGTRCVGARTSNGKIHSSDITIVALGADVTSLLPQLSNRVTGRCWGVVHIQLTPEEADSVRGIPVTNVRDLAFFFEPDKATNKLKFCHMGGGFTNYKGDQNGLSLPHEKLEDSQFIPAEDEVFVRRLLREVLPQFADHPLIDAHLCWFADTADSDYVIDFVPGAGSSLAVLSGDSGHGFKMLPIFGEFVQKLLEDGQQTQPKWRWNKPRAIEVGNWRSSAGQDLKDMVRAKL